MLYFSFLVARIVDGDLRAQRGAHSSFLVAIMMDGMFPMVTVVATSSIYRLGAINGVTMYHKIWPGAIIVQHKGWRIV